MNTGRHLQNLTYLVWSLLVFLFMYAGLLLFHPDFSETANKKEIQEEIATPLVSPEEMKVIRLGSQLFKNKCASCHAKNMKAKLTGPALSGVENRWDNRENLFSWIRNSQAYAQTNDDEYVRQLLVEYDNKPMPPFSNLTDEEIEAILIYIKSVSKT